VDVAWDLWVTAGGEQHSAVGMGGMREQRNPTRQMIATKAFWETEGHEEGRGVEAPALLAFVGLVLRLGLVAAWRLSYRTRKRPG
jgi:hypothetical protein